MLFLTGGAQAKNVFWQVGSSAIIGDYNFVLWKHIGLTSITMNSHATAVGRMLCRNGSNSTYQYEHNHKTINQKKI